MSGEHWFQRRHLNIMKPEDPISLSLYTHKGVTIALLPAEEGAVSKIDACLTFSLAMAQPHTGAPPM